MTWRTVRLVAERELVTRRRAFAVSTGIILTIVIAGLIALELSGVAEGTELAEEDADQILATFGTAALFGTIIGYGQMTLLGVAEEKSSRVVEVVLGAVEPAKLLAGKVIGIGLFALAQMALILGATAATLLTLDTVPIPSGTWTALTSVFVFFLLGFAFYSTVYAAFGALMARTENASNAAGPLNLVVSIGYMTGVISSGAGDSTFARVLSMLPPFTPTVMPMRIVGGHATMWEVAIAVGLLAASAYWVTRLAARIYIGGIMRGGAKTRLRDALRAADL